MAALSESFLSTKQSYSAEEVRQNKRGYLNSTYWKHEYYYQPTGDLSLQIDEYGARGCKKVWKDTKRKPLEEQLGEFIVGIEHFAAVRRQETLKREEEKRQWAIEEARQQEVQKRRYIQQRHAKQLIHDAEAWEQAEKIRRYAQSLRELE